MRVSRREAFTGRVQTPCRTSGSVSYSLSQSPRVILFKPMRGVRIDRPVRAATRNSNVDGSSAVMFHLIGTTRPGVSRKSNGPGIGGVPSLGTHCHDWPSTVNSSGIAPACPYMKQHDVTCENGAIWAGDDRCLTGVSTRRYQRHRTSVQFARECLDYKAVRSRRRTHRQQAQRKRSRERKSAWTSPFCPLVGTIASENGSRSGRKNFQVEPK